MCNLYSTKQSVDEVRSWFKVDRIHPSAGNLPAQPSIFPAYDAPVVRLTDDDERELTMMNWGFVLPQQGKAPKHVNNCRDDKATTSRFWSASFRERRCLVPASSFAEYYPTERNEKGHKAIAWFALKVMSLGRLLPLQGCGGPSGATTRVSWLSSIHTQS